MRFASCTEKIEISGIRKCFEGAAPGSVNLGLGQPDFDTPDHIKKAAIEAIEKGLCGYTPNCGVPQLRSALAEKFRSENKIDCTPEEIMVTSGASEALFLVISALVDRGDEVLVGDPSFLSYAELTKLVGGRPVSVPLDENLRLAPEAIEERITDKTRLIIVNSPSNPTGSVQTAEQMRSIAEIAEDKDIAVLSDEVYEHFIYQRRACQPGPVLGQRHHCQCRLQDLCHDRLEAGLSGGQRLRSGAAAQDSPVCSGLRQLHLPGCGSGGHHWAPGLRALMRDEFRSRRDLLVNGFREMGVDLIEPEGAFYLFPRVGDGDAVAAALGKAGVITVPGSAFGPGGKEHIRISYAAARSQLVEALRRMKDIL